MFKLIAFAALVITGISAQSYPPSGPGGGSGTVSGLTANCVPKAGSATSITGCSAITDAAGALISTETLAAPGFIGTGPAALILTSNTTPNFSTGTLNNNAGTIQFANGAQVVGIPETIASGSATLGTSAIAATTCSSAVTIAAPGTLTTDNAGVFYASDPAGTTGYGTGLRLVAYPTVDNISIKACNDTAGSITPAALAVNYSIVRPGGYPAISVKQGFFGLLETPSGPVVSSSPISTSTGNLLFVAGRLGAASPTSCVGAVGVVTDTAGDTFTQIGALFPDPGGSGYCFGRWYASGITGNASNTITLTWNQSSVFQNFSGLEIVGVTTLDAQPTPGGGTNGATTGTFTTTAAREILVGGIETASVANTFTPGAGFTLSAASLDSRQVGQAEYKIVSSIQTGVAISVTSAVASTSITGASFK